MRTNNLIPAVAILSLLPGATTAVSAATKAKGGRYDVDARLIGENGSIHPAYYLVIERL